MGLPLGILLRSLLHSLYGKDMAHMIGWLQPLWSCIFFTPRSLYHGNEPLTEHLGRQMATTLLALPPAEVLNYHSPILQLELWYHRPEDDIATSDKAS